MEERYAIFEIRNRHQGEHFAEPVPPYIDLVSANKLLFVLKEDAVDYIKMLPIENSYTILPIYKH